MSDKTESLETEQQINARIDHLGLACRRKLRCRKHSSKSALPKRLGAGQMHGWSFSISLLKVRRKSDPGSQRAEARKSALLRRPGDV